MFIQPSNRSGKYVHQPNLNLYSDEFFLNAFPFLELLVNYDSVEAVCYTVDSHIADMINLKRLIYNKVYGNLDKKLQTKQIVNLHTKMYICKMSKTVSVFVGSWNLVSPSYLECVVQIPKQYNKKAQEYFNQLWNAS